MRFFYHKCDVARQASTGEGISKTLQPLYTGIQCLITPMDTQATVDNGWEFGQGYDAFFDPGTDIKKGDKITFGNIKLVVQGIKEFTNIPYVSHIQALCQREEQ